MAKIPAVPEETRSFSADKIRDRLRSAEPGRRDEVPGLGLALPGDDGGARRDVSRNAPRQDCPQDR